MRKILVVSCELDIPIIISRLERVYKIPSSSFVFLIEDFNDTGIFRERNEYYVIRDFSIDTEITAIIKRIAQSNLIVEVISNDEFSVFVAAYIRERLQLSGMTCEIARKYRDKQQMKRVASEHGISTPEEFSLDRIIHNEINFPLVLKPRSLAGSVGVKVLNSIEDLPDELILFQEEYRDMDDGQYILEAYNPQDIFHIDCVILAGKIAFISVGAYEGKPLDYLHGKLLGCISVSQENVAALWRPFTERLRAAFNFPDGVFHIEAFGGDSIEPALLEIAFRSGGGPITDAILHAYGIDLREIHLAAQLGLISKVTVSRLDNAYAYLLYPKNHSSSETMKVTNVTMPNIKNLSTLKTYALANVGDLASGEFYSHKDCLGMFIFSGELTIIKQDYNRVKKECNLEIGQT